MSENDGRSKSTPNSGEFMKAIGSGCSTIEVARKLGISIEMASKNLRTMRRLKFIKESSPNHWRKL